MRSPSSGGEESLPVAKALGCNDDSRDVDQKIDERQNCDRGVISCARMAAPGCVTCSFQTECMALVDLVIAQRPDIPVLFLETGYHFPETYAYRDQMTERLHLNLVNLASKITVAEQESQFGILNQTAPDRCCGMRKVEPLFRGLDDYGVWFTALRREQSPTRANLQSVDHFKLPTGQTIAESEPAGRLDQCGCLGLFETARHSRASALRSGLHQHWMRALHHTPVDPDNPRSGRWSGHKLECGIHIQSE